MAQDSPSNLFKRLTKLFRSGPVVKRKVLNFNDNTASSAFEAFRKNQSQVYSTAMSAYGTYDRMARYSDFSEMEYTPEIAGALDIYAEESAAADEQGKVLHVYSENPRVKDLLEDMFYDTLNVEFNLPAWVRNLVKYGDFFLFNDVNPKYGIINAYPIPISEVEREEGFDPDDPMAVRFRWITQGNQVLENWQVTHMRLLGNDAFLPYGSSILEPARRIWRQMILLEDAMLVFRIVRAPARRAFYIDVGNVPPEDIPNYMQQAQSALKKSSVVDRSTGRVDLRYNPLSIDEDYFIPVRGGESGTKIEAIEGQQMTGEPTDVEYIQKKLFAALKVPKAYLGYEEGLGSKATLSQQDIRFARTIARVQRTVLAELNKIAIVHLYCNGYTGEDLLDFKISLSTPSTIAQLQKLELIKSRFEAAGTVLQTPGLVDRNWVQKNVLRLSDEELRAIEKGLKKDKIKDLEIEAVQIDTGDADAPAADVSPDLGFGGGDEGGAAEAPAEEAPPEEAPPISELSKLSLNDDNAPIKVANVVDKITNMLSEEAKEKSDSDEKIDALKSKEKEKKRKQQKRKKRGVDELPSDHTRADKDSQKNTTGLDNILTDLRSGLKPGLNPVKGNFLEEIRDEFTLDEYLDSKIEQNASMTGRIQSTLKSLDDHINSKPHVISEKNSSGEKK